MIAQGAEVEISTSDGIVPADASMLADFLGGCAVRDIEFEAAPEELAEIALELGDSVFVVWHCPVAAEPDTYHSFLFVKDGQITSDSTANVPPVVAPPPLRQESR